MQKLLWLWMEAGFPNFLLCTRALNPAWGHCNYHRTPKIRDENESKKDKLQAIVNADATFSETHLIQYKIPPEINRCTIYGLR